MSPPGGATTYSITALCIHRLYSETQHKLLSVIMLSVAFGYCYAETCCSECHYAHAFARFLSKLDFHINFFLLNLRARVRVRNRVFVPGKAFKPSVMFASKAGAYPSSRLEGKLLDIPANITLGWKSLTGPNTIA